MAQVLHKGYDPSRGPRLDAVIGIDDAGPAAGFPFYSPADVGRSDKSSAGRLDSMDGSRSNPYRRAAKASQEIRFGVFLLAFHVRRGYELGPGLPFIGAFGIEQALAAAAIHRYGELGGSPRAVFDLLLKFATSEDGALHAEKYYRTVTEEFAATRPAFRWRQLVALARVTASAYGMHSRDKRGGRAPGYEQARELLGLA